MCIVLRTHSCGYIHNINESMFSEHDTRIADICQIGDSWRDKALYILKGLSFVGSFRGVDFLTLRARLKLDLFIFACMYLASISNLRAG